MRPPTARAARAARRAFWLTLAGLLTCGREPREAPGAKPEAARPAAPAPPAAAPVPAPVPAPAPETPRYRRCVLTGAKDLQDLRDALGPERFAEMLKLNRIDLGHARQGEALVVPTRAEAWLDLGPFPRQWPEVASQPKFIGVSLRLQAWAAYEGGALVRWGPVSTGKKATPTYAGLYHTNWCQKERRSTFNDEWQLKWYVNLHNWNGISFHQYALPGYPDSHSCVRLSEDDSAWIYRWCQPWVLAADQRHVDREGTPVVVFGDYAWGAPKPWTKVLEAPAEACLSVEELRQAVDLFNGRVAPPSFPDPALRSQSPLTSKPEVQRP